MQISLIQFLLLAATALLFTAAFFLGLSRMRRTSRAVADSPAGLPHELSMGPAARAAVAAGTILGLILFVWRAIGSQQPGAPDSIPGSNPFDTFLILGLLLSLGLAYFRWTRHLHSLSFFLLPMIVILQLLGLVLAAVHQNAATTPPDLRNVWVYIHLVTIVASTICFVVACAGGIGYLIADRQLRQKGLNEGHRWMGLPPLASLEKVNRWMVYTGFPLLTISTVAGILQIHAQGEPAAGTGGPGAEAGRVLKIGFGILAWLVYVVLAFYMPLNPRLRGRKAAWLAIVGLVLFLAAFAAAKWS